MLINLNLTAQVVHSLYAERKWMSLQICR